MPRRIVVSTGARLHFGLFAHGTHGERQFGGVGLMVSRPGFELRATRSDADEVLGEEKWSLRLSELVARYRACCPNRQLPAIRWEITQSLPAHAGLGSATQLGLAAAKVLSLFAGETDIPAPELARRTGRGKRSAVGLYGFDAGGLLVEGGKLFEDAISPLVARASVPQTWRLVLIRPRDASGLSGTAEVEGFSRLSPMPRATTDRLCRLALFEILPSVIETDFDRCAEAVYEFGQRVGEYFLPIQGGVYADPRMRDLALRLRSRGIRGIGQSSWGPTLFVLCPDDDAAKSLAADLSADRACTNCELTIAEPLNRGADVVVDV